ncbi:uncharacterized [Tachysurus ichikawai]
MPIGSLATLWLYMDTSAGQQHRDQSRPYMWWTCECFHGAHQMETRDDRRRQEAHVVGTDHQQDARGEATVIWSLKVVIESAARTRTSQSA